MDKYRAKEIELRRQQMLIAARFGPVMEAHKAYMMMKMANKDVLDYKVALSSYEISYENAKETLEALEKDPNADKDDIAFAKADVVLYDNILKKETQRFEEQQATLKSSIEQYEQSGGRLSENVKNIVNSQVKNVGMLMFEARIKMNDVARRINNAFTATVETATNKLDEMTSKAKEVGAKAYNNVLNIGDTLWGNYHNHVAQEFSDMAKDFSTIADGIKGLGDKVNELREYMLGMNVVKQEAKARQALSMAERFKGVFISKAEKAFDKADAANEKYNAFMDKKDHRGPLLSAIEKRVDEYTQFSRQHQDRAMEYFSSIAEREGLSTEERENTEYQDFDSLMDEAGKLPDPEVGNSDIELDRSGDEIGD